MPIKSHPINIKWLNATAKTHAYGNKKQLHRLLALEDDHSISYRSFLDLFTEKTASEDKLDALLRSVRTKLGLPIKLEDLIDYDREETALPADDGFYTGLEYSRFLTYVPNYEVEQGLEAPCVWCNERCQFVQVNPSPHLPQGTLQFKGVAVNNLHDGAFVLVATRVSPFLFTLTGYHPRRAFSFQATFTKCYRDGTVQVLSGSWIGMDHLCHSSQFRCLLAANPIDHDTITKVLAKHSICYERSANEWEQTEPPKIPSDILIALKSEPDHPGSVDRSVDQHEDDREEEN